MKKREPEHVPTFHLDWKSALSRALRKSRKTVVLGVGNPDKGDDGAGPACAARLRSGRADAPGNRWMILDGRETPESRTGEIRRFGPELTIIIDASIGGRPPGTVFVVEKDKIADEGVSSHALSLRYLVRYLEESMGSRVLILGVEPEDIEIGAPMSKPVIRAVNEIVSSLSLALESTSA